MFLYSFDREQLNRELLQKVPNKVILVNTDPWEVFDDTQSIIRLLQWYYTEMKDKGYRLAFVTSNEVRGKRLETLIHFLEKEYKLAVNFPGFSDDVLFFRGLEIPAEDYDAAKDSRFYADGYVDEEAQKRLSPFQQNDIYQLRQWLAAPNVESIDVISIATLANLDCVFTGNTDPKTQDMGAEPDALGEVLIKKTRRFVSMGGSRNKAEYNLRGAASAFIRLANLFGEKLQIVLGDLTAKLTEADIAKVVHDAENSPIWVSLVNAGFSIETLAMFKQMFTRFIQHKGYGTMLPHDVLATQMFIESFEWSYPKLLPFVEKKVQGVNMVHETKQPYRFGQLVLNAEPEEGAVTCTELTIDQENFEQMCEIIEELIQSAYQFCLPKDAMREERLVPDAPALRMNLPLPAVAAAGAAAASALPLAELATQRGKLFKQLRLTSVNAETHGTTKRAAPGMRSD